MKLRYFNFIWSSPSRTTRMTSTSPKRGNIFSRATSSRIEVDSPLAITKVWVSMLYRDTKSSKSPCCNHQGHHSRASYSLLDPAWFKFFETPGSANIWCHASKSWFDWVLDSNLMSALGSSPSPFSFSIWSAGLLEHPLLQDGGKQGHILNHCLLYLCSRTAEELLIKACLWPPRSDLWQYSIEHNTHLWGQ